MKHLFTHIFLQGDKTELQWNLTKIIYINQRNKQTKFEVLLLKRHKNAQKNQKTEVFLPAAAPFCHMFSTANLSNKTAYLHRIGKVTEIKSILLLIFLTSMDLHVCSYPNVFH